MLHGGPGVINVRFAGDPDCYVDLRPMTALAALLLWLLASQATAQDHPCPEWVIGGTKKTIMPVDPQATGVSSFGPLWACPYKYSASVVYLKHGGISHPIGLVSTLRDCEELEVTRFLAEGHLVCLEFVTTNSGCELPVPEDTSVTCFRAAAGPLGHWTRTETALLHRTAVEVKELEGPDHDRCIAAGLPADNCVTQTFRSTEAASAVFKEGVGLCVLSADSSPMAVLGYQGQDGLAACAQE
jgi:hypothetical protein